MTELWDWSLEAYARPGAADACLALQDEHKQNVPLVLWVIWAGIHELGPDAAAIREAAAIARSWQNGVIGPVRELRRMLKLPIVDVEESDRGAIRAQVKTTELDAERRLLRVLEPLAVPSVQRGDLAQLLGDAATAYGAPLPPSAFVPLLRCLNLPSGSR